MGRYDKQQLVVAADGALGMVFEHSYSDGTAWSRLIGEVMADVEGAPPPRGCSSLPEFTFSEAPIPREVHIETPPEIMAATWDARAKSEALSAQVELEVVEFAAFGKEEMKGWGVSPDAAVQMALQLAFHRQHNHVLPPTYEACATRAFLHGRTETIRTSSTEVLTLCSSWDRMKQEERDAAQAAAEVAAAEAEAAATAATEALEDDGVFTAPPASAEGQGGDAVTEPSGEPSPAAPTLKDLFQ
eukprot:gene30398-37994_t